MRKKAWLVLPAALTSLAILIPAAPAGAETNPFGRCPDGYMAAPAGLASGEDKNGNGVICFKIVPTHEITHDDPNGTPYDCNGFPTPPAGCSPGNIALIIDDYLPL